MKKIIFALLVTCFVAVGCKNEQKDAKATVKTEVKAENIENVSFKISGMTCEVGCAKYINSKLAKADGVIEANVIFADSIATVKFDKTKTDATKLMRYVDGMADNTYKTSNLKEADNTKENSNNKTTGKTECPKGCCQNNGNKMACDENCKKSCNRKS